jgi:hypothetical protein
MAKNASKAAPAAPPKSVTNQTATANRPGAEPKRQAPAASERAPLRETPSEDDIRRSAYLKWEAAGRPEGHDLFFWVEAERELCGGA